MNFKAVTGKNETETPTETPAIGVPTVKTTTGKTGKDGETPVLGNPAATTVGTEKSGVGVDKNAAILKEAAAAAPAADGTATSVIPSDSLKRSQMTPPPAREEIAVPAPLPPVPGVGTASGWGFFFLVVFCVAAIIVFFAQRHSEEKPMAEQTAENEVKSGAAPKQKPKPERRKIIDYGGDNTREVVDLISAPLDVETVPQPQRKNDFKPEPNGNFEIRV